MQSFHIPLKQGFFKSLFLSSLFNSLFFLSVVVMGTKHLWMKHGRSLEANSWIYYSAWWGKHWLMADTWGVCHEITILNICRHLTQVWFILCCFWALWCISSCRFLFLLFMGINLITALCRLRQHLACCLISAFFILHFSVSAGLFCLSTLATDQLLSKILSMGQMWNWLMFSVDHIFLKCLLF